MDGAARRAALALLHRAARGDGHVLAPQARVEASHPWGRTGGTAAGLPWADLRRAIPDVERRDLVVLAGRNHPDDRMPGARPSPILGTLGAYVGTFREPLAGIPPTGGVVALPYGEAHHVVEDRLRASWLVWDLAGLMIATGAWPMARPLGAPGHWPAPATGDGVRLDPDPEDAGGSLASVLEMHELLDTFGGGSLDGIDMRHWADGFLYWAGGAIGACKGVEGFRLHHQGPYRRAFPGAVGAGHFIRVSDGPYAVTGGDVALRHTGEEYMGVAATGRDLRFRVMDFYRFDGAGRIAENWLPNDTLGLLAQMGVDVLARVAHLDGRPRRDL